MVDTALTLCVFYDFGFEFNGVTLYGDNFHRDLRFFTSFDYLSEILRSLQQGENGKEQETDS